MLILALLLALLPSQTGRPAKPPKPPKQLYDSTKVSYTLPPGISHKTAQQAIRTYGKIGEGKPLDHTDSVFLKQRDPAYLRARAAQEARQKTGDR
jgi:hypothetical protein